MTDLYIGQNYAQHVGKYESHSAGSQGGDGWPWGPGGIPGDPGAHINWNAPNAAEQAQRAYEQYVNWLKNHADSYNGFLMLLRFTLEIGEHLNQLPPAERAKLSQFLSNELKGKGGHSLLAEIVDALFEGAAYSSKTKEGGENAARKILEEIMQCCKGLQGQSPFSQIFDEASKDLNGLNAWISKHWGSFPDGNGGSVQGWVDRGGDHITFAEFTGMAAFSLGTSFTEGSNTNEMINAYYEAEIQQLVAEFKGNPWALLIALMGLINQRDQDDGAALNGYGDNLKVLTEANALIKKLLQDLGGKKPNAADFFATLNKLRTLVEQNPALSGLVKELQGDINTIDHQRVTLPPNYSWTVGPGYYQFPPGMAGTTITVNGKSFVIPANGKVYFSQKSTIQLPDGQSSFTFGELAAMGDTQAIQQTMAGWDSKVMSNFENGVTGIQTLLNGASPAIQQQIQTTTQLMQARENFEKQAYSSITTMNQMIMKMIQQVMG